MLILVFFICIVCIYGLNRLRILTDQLVIIEKGNKNSFPCFICTLNLCILQLQTLLPSLTKQTVEESQQEFLLTSAWHASFWSQMIGNLNRLKL